MSENIQPGMSPVPVTAGLSKPSKASKKKDYTSEGVQDNDIFLLPVSDFQVLGILTVVAAVVRLFRIYQPSSVVFDEVQ
jgi:dolichyl-phosphate-mannose-protein mannosyltransferase